MEINSTDDVYTPPLDLAQLKRMVQQFVDVTQESATMARKCRDYYDGEQISPHIRAELMKRGQPPIHTNKIQPAIQGLFGILDAGESAPEALPRNYTDQDAADTATKVLRYVCDKAKHKQKRKLASENFLIQHSGAVLLGWNGKHVTEDRIHWDEFVFDPLSKELDFSDARYLGLAKLLDEDQIKARYPSYKGIGAGSGEIDALTFFADDERKKWWAPTRKQARVVELYYVDGKGGWHRAVFTNDDILEVDESAYHNDLGETICPIEAVTYEMRRDGFRYGPVLNAIPMQDEINARRSRMLHLTNHRQVQQTDQFAPPQNQEIARREAGKADGALPYGWAALPAPDMAQGQMLLLQKSEADLDRMFPTPAVLGRVASSNESGRARQILQQAGYTELARAFGRFEAWEHNVFTKMWWIAREYLTEPQMVRITDDPRSPGFLKVNNPVMGQVMQPTLHPATGEQMIHPVTGVPHFTVEHAVVGIENQIAQMDVDIILSTVPDVATLEQEVFQMLTDYASATKSDPFDPRFIAMVEMSPLPNKREVVERLQRLKQETDQQNAAQAQAQQQAAIEQHQADVAVKQGKAAKEQAQAQLTVAQTEKTAQEVHMVEGSLWNAAYGQPHPPVWGSQGL